MADLCAHLSGHDIKVTGFRWEETPLRTAVHLLDAAWTLPSLSVLMGAIVTGPDLGEEGCTGSALRVAGVGGERLTIPCGQVVLATGVIGTPRILLASDDRMPDGIGDAHDLVGRWYSDHPEHDTADMEPDPVAPTRAGELQYSPEPRFSICFAQSDAAQRAERLTGQMIDLTSLYETRAQTIRRMQRGAPAARDAVGRVSACRIELVTEQVPNRDSRVTLAAERNALGMRRALLDWRLTEEDARSLAWIMNLPTRRVEAAGLGLMRFDQDPPTLDDMADAAHSMGTTRMAARPQDGVVDPDRRVFRTETLYAASSAGLSHGSELRTDLLTIFALARRLALHLDATATAKPATAPTYA